MDDTTTAPVSGGTPKLNAALAKFQAQVPKITKDEQANVGTYKYSYADLTAITAEALPLLGKHGLAFTAWPTLVDGKFVLLYELLHESGEQKSGIFPLAGSGKPQELGGLITYYRRYALCAVTGIAPGGEDDDVQSANHQQQFDRPRSAAQAFENAVPAPARQRETARPAAAAAEAETDTEWLAHVCNDLIPAATTRDELTALWAGVERQVAGGKCTEKDAKDVKAYLGTRAEELGIGKPAAA